MDPEKSVCAGKLVNTQHNQQKREDDSLLGYGVGLSSNFLRCSQSSEASSAAYRSPTNEEGRKQDWDPDVMLNNLFFLERKIHQLQDLVHLMVGRKKNQVELVGQQQQLLKADLTSILVQPISTAGNLLPSVKLGEVLFLPEMPCAPRYCDAVQETEPHHKNAEHEPKDDEGKNLPHQILQVEKDEILAPHTHFCTICGKGFKRDANLRMHMRGHGDEYKTPEALAKPNKGSGLRTISTKRYSCPYAGCKRNKDHKKFQPLKTILCVKNHYKRTHCDKRYTCSRCHVKKFSVIADLKTHEKHCGKDKWLCSCGTTFSRKDKLFGHIVLFQGHTPALPFDEKGSFGASDLILNSTLHKFGRVEFNTSSDDPVESGIKNDRENIDELFDHFSPMNFDTCNFGGFHEFPRPIFEDLEGSFSLFLPGSCN